jgi:hypothetical protein
VRGHRAFARADTARQRKDVQSHTESVQPSQPSGYS